MLRIEVIAESCYKAVMDVESLISDCRNYLRNKAGTVHQKPLAKDIGVPHSWLNKFLRGHFSNLRPKRLQQIATWVENDRNA